MRRVVLAACFLALFTSPAHAQHGLAVRGPSRFLVGFGIGTGTTDDKGGISFGVGASYRQGGRLFSLRFVSIQEVQLVGSNSPAEGTWDLGGLIGVASRAPNRLKSLSGGVSFVGGVRRGENLHTGRMFHGRYEKETFSTIGIPLEAQVLRLSSEGGGFGLRVFADVNDVHPFVGVWVCVIGS